MTKRKLQVFISSTFEDLKEERQVAVESILKADHIPAGMELFKSNNNSQWETITKWIDQSDIYLLILGGRYGSIKPGTGKSYTHLEYEYALYSQMPCFAIVLSDSFLEKKAMTESNVYEAHHINEYNDFKAYVKTRMIKDIDDLKDIQIAIYESIKNFENEFDFSGWIPGDSLKNYIYVGDDSENTSLQIKHKIETLEDKLQKIEVRQAENKLSKMIDINELYSKSDLLLYSDSRKKRKTLYYLFSAIRTTLRFEKRSSRQIKRALEKKLLHRISNNHFEKMLSEFISLNLIKVHSFLFFRIYELTDLGHKVDIEYSQSSSRYRN